MTDDEGKSLSDVGDSLAEYWTPMDTLAKYMGLGLAKEVKATSKLSSAMPQFKLIAKELDALKKKAKPFAKETYKLAIAWMRAGKAKAGDIKKYQSAVKDYFKKLTKMKLAFDTIQRLVDEMSAELEIQVQGDFQMKKYLAYRKHVVHAEKRIFKSCKRFLAVRSF